MPALVIASPGQAQPEVTIPSGDASYLVALTVDDGRGGTASAQTTYTADATPPLVTSVEYGTRVFGERPVFTVPVTAELTVTFSEDVRGGASSPGISFIPDWLATVRLDRVTDRVHRYSASFNGPDAGTFDFSISAADLAGNALVTQPSSPRFSVNRTPEIFFVSQPAGRTGVSIPFSGAQVSDPDQDAVAFSWSLLSRPSSPASTLTTADLQNAGGTATVSNQSAPGHASFIPDVPGSYTFRLTVNDGRGGVATRDLVVTAARSTENSPPIAVIQPVPAVTLGVAVQLDGTGSVDRFHSDSVTLAKVDAYTWTLQTPAGSTGASLSLNGSDPSSPRPFFTPDAPGDYVVSLVVTDNEGAQSPPARVTISARQDEPNTPGLVTTTLPGAPASTAGAIDTSADIDVFAFDPRTDFVYDVSVGAHAPLSATVELIRADGSPIRLPAATAIAPGTTGVLRTYRSPFKQADGRERVYVRVSSTGGRTSGGYTLRVTERAEAADAVPRVTLELSLADPANPEAVLGTTATSVPISNLSVLVAYDGRSLVARQAFSLVTGAFAFAAQQFDPPNLSLQLASPQFERAPLPGGQLAGLLFRSLSSFPEQRERLASVQEVRVTTGATLVVRRSTADPGVSRQVRLDAPLQAVLLDGSRSTDGGREVVGRGAPRTSGLNYHWTQVGPTPALVALAGARTATPSFQPAVEGPYRFRLVVDNEVLSSPPEEVEIVVRFEHLEPSAAVLARVRGSAKGAGVFVSSQDSGSSTGPLPVAVPATVDLDGSGSVDPDRSGAAGLRYRWTQTAGPPIDLSSPGSVLSTFVSVAVPVASAGLYAFQLVTEDADGLPSRPTMVQLSAAALARPGPMLALSAQTSGGSPEPDLGETPLLSQAEGLRTVLDATTGFQTEIRNRRSTGLSAVAPALVTAGPPSLPGSDGGGGLPLSGSSFGQTPA